MQGLLLRYRLIPQNRQSVGRARGLDLNAMPGVPSNPGFLERWVPNWRSDFEGKWPKAVWSITTLLRREARCSGMIGYCSFVKEAGDHRWILPGGWADVTESPAAAVAREVREEAGIEVRPYKLAALWDRSRHPHGVGHRSTSGDYSFCGEIIGGELRTGPETSGVAFFSEHELTTELSTRQVLLPQLRRMFEHMRQPELPTEFD